MAPNFFARQFVDDMEWSEPRVTGTKNPLVDEDDVLTLSAGRQRNCVDCGQAIPDGAKFCPSCGREQ
ncbi:MAG: zinc ribbon domain-containing protein [Acidobacteria bacterium]|nr:zinc ribbon domain-containing protein [Acidobacteriota bacterium]